MMCNNKDTIFAFISSNDCDDDEDGEGDNSNRNAVHTDLHIKRDRNKVITGRHDSDVSPGKHNSKQVKLNLYCSKSSLPFDILSNKSFRDISASFLTDDILSCTMLPGNFSGEIEPGALPPIVSNAVSKVCEKMLYIGVSCFAEVTNNSWTNSILDASTLEGLFLS